MDDRGKAECVRGAERTRRACRARLRLGGAPKRRRGSLGQPIEPGKRAERRGIIENQFARGIRVAHRHLTCQCGFQQHACFGKTTFAHAAPTVPPLGLRQKQRFADRPGDLEHSFAQLVSHPQWPTDLIK